MSNEKQLVGQELVDFLMSRFNMTEDEALQNLAENIGNVKLDNTSDEPKDIPGFEGTNEALDNLSIFK
jgi:hypothetical protein